MTTEATVVVTCPCGRWFDAAASQAARRVRCPGCDRPVAVPAVSAPSPDPASVASLSARLDSLERSVTGVRRSLAVRTYMLATLAAVAAFLLLFVFLQDRIIGRLGLKVYRTEAAVFGRLTPD